MIFVSRFDHVSTVVKKSITDSDGVKYVYEDCKNFPWWKEMCIIQKVIYADDIIILMKNENEVKTTLNSNKSGQNN